MAVLPNYKTLHQKSKPVKPEEFPEIVLKLKSFFDNNECSGIAAPQLNIPLRAFIFHGKVAINPVIKKYSKQIIKSYEGCLSLDGMFYVTRSKTVKVEYIDETGKTINEKLNGFESIVFQHEYDHLEGILINDINRNDHRFTGS